VPALGWATRELLHRHVHMLRSDMVETIAAPAACPDGFVGPSLSIVGS